MKLVILCSFIFLCSFVVGNVGVVPGSYEVNFEPSYSGEFVFNFVVDGKVDLEVSGNLSEFVSLDKKSVSGSEEVVVSLNLPPVIKKAGINRIFVEAGDIRGEIKVSVPYPKNYVDVELVAPNVDFGEIVNIDLKMTNRDSIRSVFNFSLEIYEDLGSGDLGDLVEGDYSVQKIDGLKTLELNAFFNSSKYVAGKYVVVAFVDHGDRVDRFENYFRVGNFSVGILNWTDEFVEGEVNKFEIEVENLWGKKMNEVYAEVRIEGVEIFNTPIVSLDAWEKKVLVGFFDSSVVSGSDFDAEIILHFDGGFVSEIASLNIVKGVSYLFYGILFFCVLIFVVGLFFRKRK